MPIQIQKRLDLIVTKNRNAKTYMESHIYNMLSIYQAIQVHTYIQISPDFPRITQKANKQVNTSVPSVVRLKYLYRN